LKEDCETAEGDERSRPRSDRTDENVEKVWNLVHSDSQPSSLCESPVAFWNQNT
jgi:hypothetical protein